MKRQNWIAAALLVSLIASTATSQEQITPVEAETQPAATEVEAGAPTEPAKPHTVKVGAGKLTIVLPGTWEHVEPATRIIEHEFLITTPPVEGASEKPPAPTGRLTISQAGGTIEANMQRWIGQFRLGRDADGADAMKKEKTMADPLVIHQLDIAGTYFDMPRGPFGPKTERPDYRMLGAMIETPDEGTWYIKFYGPQVLVEAEAEAFHKMVADLKWQSEKAQDDAADAE